MALLSKHIKLALVGAMSALVLTACATTTPADTSVTTTVSAPAKSIEMDRKAILAMAGNYDVTFHFEETVSFKKGYEFYDSKDSGAYEVVYVIADDPGFISLQHILVVGGDQKFPVKHWRQDWIYEPDYTYEFVGFNAWQKRELTKAESAGKWAQFVYQVDDSPRYSAIGAWEYNNGVPAWAGKTWRPLPRRDMTTRDDYQALEITNRHAITFNGWVHEQDNTKLLLTGDKPEALAREIGVNTYVKFDDFETDIAKDYWEATKEFWAGVRDVWTELERENTQFGLTLQGEPVDLYNPLLELANEIQDGEKSVSDAIKEARTAIEKYTTTDIASSMAKGKADAVALQYDAY